MAPPASDAQEGTERGAPFADPRKAFERALVGPL